MAELTSRDCWPYNAEGAGVGRRVGQTEKVKMIYHKECVEDSQLG